MQKEKPVSKFVQEAIFSVKQAIDLKPLLRLSIEELTKNLPVGRNTLHEAFKDFVGTTIIRYQLKKRMEAAAELLEGSNLTIQQIATKCGYKIAGNFTSDFKKIFDDTPSNWRKRHADN